MSDLDNVVERPRVETFRQMSQELGEVGFVERCERRELPEDGAELVAKLGQSRGKESLDEIAGLGEHLALGDEARTLQREDETVRRGVGPLPEALGRLQPVMGGVDLDGGEVARGIGQLIRLAKTLGIEHAAPWRIDPAADAGADAALLGGVGLGCVWFGHALGVAQLPHGHIQKEPRKKSRARRRGSNWRIV